MQCIRSASFCLRSIRRLKINSLGTALIYGCLFGFFTYSTYDLSNYATLRNWSLALTVVDIVWGTILAGFAATVSFWISRLVP